MSKGQIKLSNGKEVVVREPLVRDIRFVQDIKNEQARELKLMSNLTGLTDTEIDALTLKDYALLQKALSGFLS